MKKISLILALMLVLTCGVFTACGGDDTSSKPATSTASKADDSSVASEAESDAESEAESNVDASTDDSSVPSDETSAPDDKIEATGEVISVGAAYTTSKLYRQGGADVQWAYSEDAPIAYPDEDDKSLTDGLRSENSSYSDLAWAGFHANCPDYIENGYAWIIIDLAEVKEIGGVVVQVATDMNEENKGAGTGSPAAEFLISEDGENWTSIGSDDSAGKGEMVALSAGCAANAQYVQVRLSGNGWIFVSEVEVLGTTVSADTSDASVAE